ncbi:Ig-like domain-containing protein, partial [Oceanimonas baumannii]|uniref:beta strand repeat-containing protein n=2 Tax=Oceanimonas baumannii TaxID=129578 RepID=UPI001D186C8C
SFSYTATDGFGNTVTNTVVITIVDDEPVAANDSNSVTEGDTLAVNAAGGVLDNDTAGADNWASGGAVVGVVAGNSGAAATNGNVGSTVAGSYGSLMLNADGSYTYVATADTINSNAQDVFTYTVQDGDGDLAYATLTINVNDVTGVPATTTGQVDEAGLPAGSSAGDGSEQIINGSLNLQSGWSVDGAQSGTAGFGSWSVNTDGTFNYTLTSATTDVDGVAETDSFSYTATDGFGNTVTNTVVITIVDDEPVAANDSNSVTEGDTLAVNAAGGVLDNDSAGADNWASGGAVVGVVAGNSGAAATNGNVGSTVAGSYGSLMLNADGSYTYVATADAINSNAQDVFTYTVEDGDGDLAYATLTINVNDVTGVPATTTGQVDEAGLPAGSSAGDGSEQIINGSLNLQSGWSVDGAQSGTAGFGSWSVNTDGTFNYTLTSATTDVDGVAETDSFSYTATDGFGNTVTNTVVITIVDDEPTVTAQNLTIANISGNYEGDYQLQIGADENNSFAEGVSLEWNNAPAGYTFAVSDTSISSVTYLAENSEGGDFFTVTLHSDGSYDFNLIEPVPVTVTNIPNVLSGIDGGSQLDEYILVSSIFDGLFDIRLTGTEDAQPATLTISNTDLGVNDNTMHKGDMLKFDVRQTATGMSSNVTISTMLITASASGGIKANDAVNAWVYYMDGSSVELNLDWGSKIGGGNDASYQLEIQTDTSKQVDYIELAPDESVGSQAAFKIVSVGVDYSTTEYPDDYQLDFSVTATDADQDTDTDDFSVSVITTDNDEDYVIQSNDGSGTIYGTEGNDTLIGGAGNDILNGGLGDNILTGGEGIDTFQFTDVDINSVNKITDFNIGEQDVVDISDLLTGADNSNLNSYLEFSLDGSDTVLTVTPSGVGSDTQEIRFEGVDLLGGMSSADLIQSMVDDNTLQVDKT